ncbi:hypothetical protein BTS2_1429 [Bacillus sp. TS-2]|nr:hypothetical protein BTS2_1429 [Bacillus sp. TS-2]
MNNKRIIGIYLAAGLSKRMGVSKLWLPYQNDYLGVIALKTALSSQLNGLIVVCSHYKDVQQFKNSFTMNECDRITFVLNEKAYLGQSSSIRAGVKEAISQKADAIVTILADQPFITRRMIDVLIKKLTQFEEQHKDITFITSCQGGTIQPPILCNEKAFSSLLSLKGDKGAKAIILGTDPHFVHHIKYENKRLFTDIDTMKDYHFLLKKN